MNKSYASTREVEAIPKTPGTLGGSSSDSDWPPGFHLVADRRWQLAQRIAASSSFAKSALLSRFLLYVCEREITGRTAEISEHQIGVQVFGRRPGYNPGEDNIVRNYARQLRHRLERYFQEEGKSEELCIQIPRGTYVPAFTPNRVVDWPLLVMPEVDAEIKKSPEAGAAEQTVPVPGEITERPAKRKFRWRWAYLLLLIPLAAVPAAVVMPWRHVPALSTSPHTLWQALFNKNHQTLLVPCDDGIVMIQNLTGHLIHLSEYINRDYLSLESPYKIDQQNMRDLDAQRYTNVTDLNAVLRFSRVAEAQRGNFNVRYARELRMDDLKDANVVLLGSSYSNPWVELFEKNLNFQFEYQPQPNVSRIVNKHPQQQELPFYDNDAAGSSHRTYAVIALVPNLNNSGWVLLVEGLTMAGTQAAVDVLFNRDEMRPVLDRAKNSDGSLRPFELLIQTRSFGSDSPQAEIIASRFYGKL